MYSHSLLLALSLGLFSFTRARLCSPLIPTLPGQPAIDPTYETIPGLPLCNPGEESTPDGTPVGDDQLPPAAQPSSGGSSGDQLPPAAEPSNGGSGTTYTYNPSSNETQAGSGGVPADGPGSGIQLSYTYNTPASNSSGQSQEEGSGQSSFSTSYVATGSPSSSTPSSQPGNSSQGNGATYKATFTRYGTKVDNPGKLDPNCQVADNNACGWVSSSGYTAAASQALFNSPASGVLGSACGSCWKISGDPSSTGQTYTSIVVIINNECPAQGNPLCTQATLSDTNSYGANVNIDLCSDSDAGLAFFGSLDGGFAIGSATSVPCSEWQGVNGTKASWLSPSQY